MSEQASRPYVLVVDDEWRLATNIVRYLERHGLRAQAVMSVESAYQAMEERTPDLAIVDMCLPDFSGIDFCQTMHSRLPSLPLVVMSARVEPDEQKCLMAFGVSEILTKPFSLSALTQLIDRSLNLSIRPKTFLAAVADRVARVRMFGIGGTG